MTQQINFAPTTPSPYGWDLSCATDLDPTMTEVGGNVILAQACARRLITPRGQLIDDASYGYDLHQFLGADLSKPDVAKIQSGITQELLKDERVLAVTTVVVLQPSASVLTVTAVIQGAAGPFTFVLGVGSVSVQLLQVSP